MVQWRRQKIWMKMKKRLKFSSLKAHMYLKIRQSSLKKAEMMDNLSDQRMQMEDLKSGPKLMQKKKLVCHKFRTWGLRTREMKGIQLLKMSANKVTLDIFNYPFLIATDSLAA